MRRRDFITFVSAATWPLATWPLAAKAQQSAKVPTIGFLGTATAAAWRRWVFAFVERLRELGWVEGRSIAIEYRWAEGRTDRIAEIAAEFVRQNVDLIVTSGTGVAAARQATSTIPIVFPMAVDPVGSGFVLSLARPGGNVTGLSIQSHDVAGKRLELLREAAPDLRRLAIMANGGYPAAVQEMDEVAATGRGFGLDVRPSEIRRVEDIAPAFEALRGQADALDVVGESFVNANRARISALALSARLPSISAFREFAEAGSLMSYGANYPDLFRRAGEYVDKILRGTRAGDLPVEQPIKFDLVINLKSAKALGVDISPMLLARANEVIE
jgi:putative ABC transport system substrate-binding protein